MKTWLKRCMFALFTALAASAPAVADDDDFNRREAVQKFATLPDGVRFPEGITANPANGDVVVGTLDFGPNRNKLVRFDRNGKVQAVRDFGATPLLGLAFRAGKVYIANLGAGKVQRIAANFNAGTPVEDVAALPHIGAPLSRLEGNPDGSSDTIVFGSTGMPGPNGLAFDSAGNLWVSDSFQGALFRIDNAAACAPVCAATLIAHDPLLATAGFPPFGANGRPIARIGEFEGIRRDGTPEGLLFPASMAILGDEMFVTNLALPLTPAVGDEPEEDVTRWNVVRIKLPKHR